MCRAAHTHGMIQTASAVRPSLPQDFLFLRRGDGVDVGDRRVGQRDERLLEVDRARVQRAGELRLLAEDRAERLSRDPDKVAKELDDRLRAGVAVAWFSLAQ